MKKRSKQQNPEQKTRNGINNQDYEFGPDQNIVREAKKKYENSGGQPVKSKFHQEKDQSS